MNAKAIVLTLIALLTSGFDAQAQAPSEVGKKMLVAYFSHTGNTRVIAQYI